MKTISVLSSTGPSALFHSEGLLVYQEMEPYIKKDEPIVLSFKGIQNCTYAFLNASVGKALIDFKDKNPRIDPVDFSQMTFFTKKWSNVVNHIKNDKIY